MRLAFPDDFSQTGEVPHALIYGSIGIWVPFVMIFLVTILVGNFMSKQRSGET